ASPVFGVTRTPACCGKSEQRRTADPLDHWCLRSDRPCLKQQNEEDRWRHDKRSTLGLLVGVALYNFLTKAVLSYSALVLEMIGILLW
ncbi:hypothetical protein ACC708_36360, partial [Rhizobium ruizarguesonis]